VCHLIEEELREAGIVGAVTRARRHLHLPWSPRIVLFAFGLRTKLHHVDDPLQAVPAVALCGGTALHLLAHVGFMYRSIHRIFR
jgi:hypothetical protein